MHPCDCVWVLNTHMQYVEHRVTFSYHQPDAELIKGGKVYDISHLQAHTARQDYNGATLSGMLGE